MFEGDHRGVVGDPPGHSQRGGVGEVGHRVQGGPFLVEHLNRATTRSAVHAGVDLGDELRACCFDVGEGGVLRKQVCLAGHDVGFGELDRVLHSTFGCRVGGLAGQHRDAVVAPEGDRCPVADRNSGDVSGGDGLLVVGVLCPAVLCARPPENPAGVAVMARVRAHNEIDGKTIASCPCCRKGSCRHAGEVLREARNG